MKEEYIIKTRKDGSKITVRDVQDSLLDILIDVDKICRENNIKYILEGGTALGAIRHKGFIPWDDDLDIAMMRDEYNKFIKVLEKKLPDKYVFPTKYAEFEHHMFSMPNNYDAFLRADIGEDYMILPPKNKRFAKHTLDINLNGPGPED